jgi:hypothetical protein
MDQEARVAISTFLLSITICYLALGSDGPKDLRKNLVLVGPTTRTVLVTATHSTHEQTHD